MNTLYSKLKLCLIGMLLCCFAVIGKAQEVMPDVKGKIVDEFGTALAGATIVSENGKNGTSANAQGDFTLPIDDGSKAIVISLSGYENQQIAIDQTSPIAVVMKADPHHKYEVVQLGYSTQLRGELSGSVASVSGEVLERAPVANLTQSFAGRFAGLTTRETFSELSRATTLLNIRGVSSARGTDPLVMIDGIICAYNSNQTLEYISANEIESVSILKDGSTQALYGIQGANGLIVITTKRGRKGAMEIKARIDQSLQQMTTQPTFYSSVDYARMRNLAAENDGQGANYLFSEDEIAHYALGDNPEYYPNNNWYDRYLKDYSSMQRIGLSITGGNDKVQYYSNLNAMHQGGQFKTEQSKYNPNANNVWVNYRSNVDMDLNRYLKAFVRLSGNVKREHTPGVGNSDVYSSIFQLPSTLYGPLTPSVIHPETGEVLDAGGQVITTERVASPTFGMLNRTGYVNHTVTNITSQFGLDLDMGFLTKGLNLSGVFAYQTNSVGSLRTTQDYERWVRTDDKDEFSFIKKGSQNNTPLAYGKSHSYYYHLTYKAAANYQRDFGKHHIGGLGYMFYQNLTKADTGSPWLLPYNRVNSGIQATYNYDNRYFIKGDMGYSGSEQYARNTRYIATPAVSGAWAISNEGFLSESDWLSNLKVRASWAKTANDQSGLARYSYLDNVTVSNGGPIGYLQYLINENQVGNANISAEVSKKTNLGLDIGLFRSFSVSLDVFKETMDNMIVSAFATIPLYQGVPLNYYPVVNTGSFENKGYELSVDYSKRLNRDLSIHLGGMIGYAKNTILNWNEAIRTEDYAYRNWEEGFSMGQQFGYKVDYRNGNGFFNSQEELEKSGLAYSFGKPRVGDLIYQDLNQDGEIDDRDKAPIGTGALPRTTYAFNGGVTYKAFDLNFLFQGVGNYSVMMGGMGIWETDFDGVFGALHQNSWTAERYEKGQEITSPALSLAKSVNHELSDYVNYDRSYLRLKNLEIGYTLPLTLSKSLAAEKIRVLFSGQNLLTWDHMKSDDFGPEGGGYAAIPVYRVYNLGISVVF